MSQWTGDTPFLQKAQKERHLHYNKNWYLIYVEQTVKKYNSMRMDMKENTIENY